MSQWQPYLLDKDPALHTVSDNLLVKPSVYSPTLDNQRDILVYLPPSYSTSARRYPVLYMHDGQNLFDEATSFAGEWRVDETMDSLSEEGVEAIVVGIPNMGEARVQEYQPFQHPYFGEGRGDAYLKFLVETVKPDIDASFRTLPDRQNTGIVGSSMGGLISLYAFFRFPRIFGFTGVFSPALWTAKPSIFVYVEASPFFIGKIYLDIGTEEYSGYRQRRPNFNPLGDHQRMNAALINKGYHPGKTLLYIEDVGGRHNEADWARRLPDALRFLLPKG